MDGPAEPGDPVMVNPHNLSSRRRKAEFFALRTEFLHRVEVRAPQILKTSRNLTDIHPRGWQRSEDTSVLTDG